MKNKFDIISGPCVLESEDLAIEIAGRLVKDFSSFEESINFYFKGSFDKANRSSINSYRGPGIEKGLEILSKVKQKFNIPVVTDIHLPEQAEAVANIVDIVQIPAFLCRQTDLVIAAAQACKKYNKKLNVKKGQFLSPEETKNIVTKVEDILDKSEMFLTERGTSFGYNNLIVDMASFQTMKSFGVKTIYDATHSIQRPGGLGTATGGKREQVLVLAKAAIAAGADGVFIETHPRPDEALSDAATCLSLDKMKSVIESLLQIYKVS